MKRIVLPLLLLAFTMNGLLTWSVTETEAKESFIRKVDKVRDGDTIELTKPVKGKKVIRFIGVDTPETFWEGSHASGNQIIPHGLAAANSLREILPEGTEVTIVPGELETDPYGRLLAYVYKDGVEVNRLLLMNGHAVTFFIWPFDPEKFSPYQQAMLAAKKKQIGIWTSIDPLEELPFMYRARVREKKPSIYVGNFDTKVYVEPKEYKKIPLEERVFFFSERDARRANYKTREERLLTEANE